MFQKDKTVSTAEHDKHTDEEEQCSPFCICTCCGVTMNIPKVLAAVTSQVETPVEVNTSLPNINLEELSYSIWQPPKIA